MTTLQAVSVILLNMWYFW